VGQRSVILGTIWNKQPVPGEFPEHLERPGPFRVNSFTLDNQNGLEDAIGSIPEAKFKLRYPDGDSKRFPAAGI
jgi:hypothetical protein